MTIVLCTMCLCQLDINKFCTEPQENWPNLCLKTESEHPTHRYIHNLSEKELAVFSESKKLDFFRWQYCIQNNLLALWQAQCRKLFIVQGKLANMPIKHKRSLHMAKHTWKLHLPTTTDVLRLCYFHMYLNLATEHKEQICCGKCLTCFRVTRVRWTAREAGTTGVCVWTAGTGGWEPGGAAHIHRLALFCNIQYWMGKFKNANLCNLFCIIY